MPNTSSANRAQRLVPSKRQNIYMRKSMNYVDLQNELNRLRAVLTHEIMLSPLTTAKPELFPYPIDQAATEHELDVALSVKLLAIEKLRRIEQALMSLQTRSYGICSRCDQEIPYARLKVQPDSRYCVPCLTLVEKGVTRH